MPPPKEDEEEDLGKKMQAMSVANSRSGQNSDPKLKQKMKRSSGEPATNFKLMLEEGMSNFNCVEAIQYAFKYIKLMSNGCVNRTRGYSYEQAELFSCAQHDPKGTDVWRSQERTRTRHSSCCSK